MTINAFFGVILDILNPLKIHPERITKEGKRMVNDLDYADSKFSVSKKDYSKIEQKNNICINVFSYENDLVYPAHISNKKFKNCMDLLLLIDRNMSISKILTDLCSIRQKVRTKNTFADIVYYVLVVKEF